MIGRPSSFTQELADEICSRLSDGESLRTICKSEHMPNRVTVFGWLLKDEFSDFHDQYNRAREIQADAMFDDMIDIADDGTNDYMENIDNQGAIIGFKLNGENIQRSKLRFEARKWTAGRLRPKKYGESKVEVEHSGTIGVAINEVSDDDLAKIISGK